MTVFFVEHLTAVMFLPMAGLLGDLSPSAASSDAQSVLSGVESNLLFYPWCVELGLI